MGIEIEIWYFTYHHLSPPAGGVDLIGCRTDALRYIVDHGNLDLNTCAEYLGVPYPTLYSWHKKEYGKQRNNLQYDKAKASEKDKQIKILKREL